MRNLFNFWRHDLSSGLVVFLVALPLCLGVGLASTTIDGMPGLPNAFSGIIAGVIGGVVVGALSKSRIGVSGPAAGLITIVLSAIITLGSFEGFLVAVVLAGCIQIIAGFCGLGIIGLYFPSSVIKGMLAAIGITLIMKEIPHLVGYDKDFFGDEAFLQADGHNTFTELIYALQALQPGAVVIGVISIGLIFVVDKWLSPSMKIFKLIPAALIVVLVGILLNQLFKSFLPDIYLNAKHLVQLPVAKNASEFFKYFAHPDWSFLSNKNTYGIALTIALVGSLETLLSVEATDKLDPEKRKTPTSHELKAQGIGNILSGILGGLPVTQVIVRSSANINAGAKTKLSAMIHGLILFISVVFLSKWINLIPLASLAAILVLVGYKLTSFKLIKKVFKLGIDQSLPFIVTIVSILLTDLLSGIGIGLAVSIFFILKRNFQNNYKIMKASNDTDQVMVLSEEVTFLNKGSIQLTLQKLPKNATFTVDGTNCQSIDFDVLEILHEFKEFEAKEKNIRITFINIQNINY